MARRISRIFHVLFLLFAFTCVLCIGIIGLSGVVPTSTTPSLSKEAYSAIGTLFVIASGLGVLCKTISEACMPGIKNEQ